MGVSEKEKKTTGKSARVIAIAIAIATSTRLEGGKHTTPHCCAVSRRHHIDLCILRPIRPCGARICILLDVTSTADTTLTARTIRARNSPRISPRCRRRRRTSPTTAPLHRLHRARRGSRARPRPRRPRPRSESKCEARSRSRSRRGCSCSWCWRCSLACIARALEPGRLILARKHFVALTGTGTPRRRATLVQLAAQLGDFAAQPVDDLGLADVGSVFGGGEVGAFGLDTAVDAGLAGDISVALEGERAG